MASSAKQDTSDRATCCDLPLRDKVALVNGQLHILTPDESVPHSLPQAAEQGRLCPETKAWMKRLTAQNNPGCAWYKYFLLHAEDLSLEGLPAGSALTAYWPIHVLEPGTQPQ